MPRNPTSGRKPGRPPKKIEPDVATLVADLAGLGHSKNEIAILLGIAPNTLESRFCKEYEAGAAHGRKKLRTKLVALALGGNIQALIFSLKNLCGMSDKSALELTGANGGPIQHAPDLSRLSDEQLTQFEALLAIAASQPAASPGGEG
jgi:hypothetical protein